MHSLQKILAQKSDKDRVNPGEIIEAEVDLAEVNDLYYQVIKSFREMGGKKVSAPERISFVLDHYSPPATIKAAENQKKMREFCSKQDIEKLFDINSGVCHQVLPEAGLVYPGMLLAATDSHTTTHGAFGAFGTGVGATDMAIIFLTGRLWFKVPEIIEIRLEGDIGPQLMAKDIILQIIGKLGQEAAVYKAVEFTGSVVQQLSMPERMVLCNMSVEMGAQTSYIAPDQKTIDFLKEQGVCQSDYKIIKTDSDYNYAQSYCFNVSEWEPVLACPHSIDNIELVRNCREQAVDQVFIGTCTGGRLNDIKVAAEIIGNQKIAPHTRLIIIPASNQILRQAINEGYLQKLISAGATISTPGCGPCLGAHQGVLAAGETCVSTSSRNFPGRMGSNQARIYSASPATAALTALEGKITGFDRRGEKING